MERRRTPFGAGRRGVHHEQPAPTLARKVKSWGIDVNQALDEAVELPDHQHGGAEVQGAVARDFFFFAAYKYDIGIYIVPKL